MVLSQTAEYALRAMAQLAVLSDGQAVRAKDLAEFTEIPVHYLSKILRKLVEAGLLTSGKGHGGGFALARPAERIRFIDILAAVDEAPDTNRCAFGWGRCDPRHPCLLHPVVAGLNQAVTEWAKGSTLADLVANPDALERYARKLKDLRSA